MTETTQESLDLASVSHARVAAIGRLGHPITATPYTWRNSAAIPRRPWIYGWWFLRNTVACVVAPGGAGKSTVIAGTALALASGRPLLGKTVHDRPQRVWLWNLEDDLDEMSRSVQAAAQHYGLAAQDFDGRLFVDSGMEGATLCTAVEGPDGFELAEDVYEALVEELTQREIDVLFLDPFVSSHEVEENANTKIDRVVKAWGRVAKAASCCIVLVHHTSKAGSGEVTALSSRGAVALINAARCTLVINRMASETAKELGLTDDERRRCISIADDKHNRAPAEAADWYRLESINLGNGVAGQPGDSVAVVMPWKLPDAFDGLGERDLYAVQWLIDRGAYRADPQAHAWAGLAVAEALCLHVIRDKARIKKLLKTWTAKGALVVERRFEPSKSKHVNFLVVGGWARPYPLPSHLEHGGGKVFKETTS